MSGPSTAISVSVRVSSRPATRKALGFPTSQARAASTTVLNGSPGRTPGVGKPSDAATAEGTDSKSDQFRLQSSAQDRPTGHHPVMTAVSRPQAVTLRSARLSARALEVEIAYFSYRAGLMSGDGPLSMRVRPTIKRDA